MRWLILMLLCVTAGCVPLSKTPSAAQVYPFPETEPEWIRNGEPLEFEKELWYPQDDIALLLDPEVLRVGSYRDVEVFVSKTDVRPYRWLYTKFDKNKFRVFEKGVKDRNRP